MVTRDEVARVSSPDGRVDAIVIESNGGATTDFAYDVQLVVQGGHGGEHVAWFYGAVRSDHAYGVNVRWVNDGELSIEYLRATEGRLNKSVVHVAGRDIGIFMRSGVTDESAPRGGMLYNLRQQK